MTKSAARKMASQIVGTETTVAAGTGTVTAVTVDAFKTAWIHITIPGAGFNGSTLKTAVKA